MTVMNCSFSSETCLQVQATLTQSYQNGDVAMSPSCPHFMSPRPHSEGLVHSDADGVQNWPKCVARKLWKLNSHLVPNCLGIMKEKEYRGKRPYYAHLTGKRILWPNR